MLLKRWRSALLWGVAVPAVVYITVHFGFLAHEPTTRFEEFGINPDSIDVEVMLDTISPQRAHMLGLVSRRPATEVIAVVLSASFCGANEFEGFRDAIERLPGLLEDRTSHLPDVITRTVGVAIDPDAMTGASYLAELASFDEIIAGGSWLNTATEKYLWEDRVAVTAGIPQIIIVSRTVTWLEGSVLVEGEKVQSIMRGADEIVEWVDGGAPVAL